MEIKVNVVDARARMSLGGRFDFSAHREFRETTEQLLAREGLSGLDIDLNAVNYLDSSALGMLLMVRDKARAVQREVRLARPSVPVRHVLDVANFQKLFQID